MEQRPRSFARDKRRRQALQEDLPSMSWAAFVLALAFIIAFGVVIFAPVGDGSREVTQAPITAPPTKP